MNTRTRLLRTFVRVSSRQKLNQLNVGNFRRLFATVPWTKAQKEKFEEVEELKKTIDVPGGKWVQEDYRNYEDVDSDDEADLDEETDANYFDDYSPQDGSALLEAEYSKAVAEMEDLEHNRLINLAIEREKAVKELDKHQTFFERVKYVPTFPESYPPTDVSQLDPTPIKRKCPRDLRRSPVIAQKIGTIRLFDEWGECHHCVVLRLDNVQVTDCNADFCPRGRLYTMQVGWGSRKLRQVPPRLLGQYNSCGVPPKKKLMTFQVGREMLLPNGTELTARHFIAGQYVDVMGYTKGWGFQGVMKKWKFKGGPASHGSTKFHRRPGSMGGSADPGRVWKGKKMPGKMGNKKHIATNLLVFRVDPKHNLLFIKGKTPGIPPKFCEVRDAYYRSPIRPPTPTFFPSPEEKELPEFTQVSSPDLDPFPEASFDQRDWVMRSTPDLPF